jgi:hypothetical protein
LHFKLETAQMQTFSGYLDRFECVNGVIIARFLRGTTEPDPSELPVLTLTLKSDELSAPVLELLSLLKGANDWLHLYYSRGAPLQIESEFGDEHVIEHSSLEVITSAYEGQDFARLAKFHYRDANQQRELVRARQLQLARVRELINDQCTRIGTKAQGHPIGSTARTLYEQQLSFLRRLLSAAEA